VEVLGDQFPEASYADHNMAISADGNHLYSLKMNWETPTTPGVRFYDYEISTNTHTRTDYIPLYQKYDLLKGMHIVDWYGNMYVAGWKGDGGNGSDNIALLKVHLGIDVVEPNPPLTVWGVGIRDRHYARPGPATLADVGAWPSPFTRWTVIGFRAPGYKPVTVRIHNSRGELVTTLRPKTDRPGYRTVSWNGTDHQARPIPAGMYIFEIDADGRTARGMVMKAR